MKNITYLRQSSINEYNGCQFSYFINNSLGITSLAGKAALMGTLCHHVAQILAMNKRNGRKADKYTDWRYLLDICWERYKREESHRFQFMPKDYKFCVSTMEKIMESPFNPLNLEIIAIEKTFNFPITDEFSIRGTIDLVTRASADTLEIIDWKTGSRKDWNTGKLKDTESLKKDIQMRLYDLAAYLLFPEYKHRLLTIIFINDGGPYTVSFTDEEREEALQILKDKYKEIYENDNPTRIKEVNKENKWKCEKVCHYGKTILPSGYSICDTIYYFMENNGIEETTKKIKEIKKKQGDKKITEGKTSNRRNVI